jgi:hypothetical protein
MFTRSGFWIRKIESLSTQGAMFMQAGKNDIAIDMDFLNKKLSERLWPNVLLPVPEKPKKKG